MLTQADIRRKIAVFEILRGVRHVRDAGYWGAAVGTPITPGMRAAKKAAAVVAVAKTAPRKAAARPKPVGDMTPAALRDELKARGVGDWLSISPIPTLNMMRDDMARAVERRRAGENAAAVEASLRGAFIDRRTAEIRRVLQPFIDRGKDPTPAALGRVPSAQVTARGRVLRFNPAWYEPEGSGPIGLADLVTVVDPGYYFEAFGERHQAIKARVRLATEADVAKFRPPAAPHLDPPPAGGPVLTGSALNVWADHFKYDQQYGRHKFVGVNGDTGPEGVRIRDLRVLVHSAPDGGLNEYIAPYGTAWRINGVSYLIEHGPDEAGATWVAKALADLREAHDAIPGARRANRSYAMLLGRSPGDAYWQKKFNNPTHTGRMSAAGGDVFIWSPEDWQRGVVDVSSLRHETGHNLDELIGRRTVGSDSPRWGQAAKDDWRGASQIAATRVSGWKWAPTPDGARGFPDGVTPYGQSSPAEDFAESVELYQTGVIGRGPIIPGGPIVDLYFRDVFPHRAAILDEVFPDIAQDQLVTIAAARVPPGTMKIAELRKLVAGYGITVPYGLDRSALVKLVEDLQRGVPPREARARAAASVR